VLIHLLTFAIFLLIGIEIREGLAHPKAALLPAIAALGGMIVPAIIFLLVSDNSHPWATVMPTDVALAIGALSLLGSRVNPSVKLFLMTLAVADDLFSLFAMGIFFRDDLDISSAFYTIGAALIGALLPYRSQILKLLVPLVTFAIIPAYIWINLFAKMDFRDLISPLAISIILARVAGKVIGITLFTYLALRLTPLRLPEKLDLTEVAGIGLLSGMGMTVSLVIADITVKSASTFNEIRSGLFLAAIISGALGLLWLKRFPASL
jgi:NhaA family Na+:H+ antiporter